MMASGSPLTEPYGVGPILAAELIGYTGDVLRFATRDQFASYAGVEVIGRSDLLSPQSPGQPSAEPRHVGFALDRYGHLFPGSLQKLNGALDALADASRATPTPAPGDDGNANTAKNPKSIAHVALTPDDFAPTVQGSVRALNWTF